MFKATVGAKLSKVPPKTDVRNQISVRARLERTDGGSLDRAPSAEYC